MNLHSYLDTLSYPEAWKSFRMEVVIIRWKYIIREALGRLPIWVIYFTSSNHKNHIADLGQKIDHPPPSPPFKIVKENIFSFTGYLGI